MLCVEGAGVDGWRNAEVQSGEQQGDSLTQGKKLSIPVFKAEWGSARGCGI